MDVPYRTAKNKRTGVIFDKGKTRWAVASFQPYKSPGVDGIFPALLQRSIEHILDTLVLLFKASFELGHVPIPWRDVRVVFIPKAGNRPADLPKSYRPISLSSFLLKTMERLVDLDIREHLCKTVPLHRTQFAYQKGKSTEVALHHIVGKIEATLDAKNVALGAFLDIEGAFDNTGFDSIATALTSRGVDIVTASWIGSMLENRNIHSSLGSSKVSIKATRGCPQGGVLSPLLWSLVIDDLLIKLCELKFQAIGYADDVAIIITGEPGPLIVNKMNRALKVVTDWCTTKQLSINPQKAILVPFSRKYKLFLNNVTICGTPVEYSDSAKYLGVTLDKKLNWNSQLDLVLGKATKAMWACSRIVGKTWGLTPKLSKWLYTTLVRPIITYASLVWWPKMQQINAIAKCNKLQRLACISICGAFRTTPTMAMEALLDLCPLHIHTMKAAAMCAVRLDISGNFKRTSAGHASILSHSPLLPASNLIDYMTKEYRFGRKFQISIPSREEWQKNNISADPTFLNWFTDGSKMECGTGAGIIGPNTKISIAMGKNSTVFQAEILAIKHCADLISAKGMKGVRLNIFTDSQAAVKALTAWNFYSCEVLSCFDSLQNLANHNKVTVCWIPGHCGFSGNEKADMQARAGSTTEFIGPEPYSRVSWSTIKGIIDTWSRDLHMKYWVNSLGLRQAKVLARPYSRRNLTSLNKTDLRLLVGFLIGHHWLKAHLHKVGLSAETTCRLCMEEDETTEHIMCECPALAGLRIKLGLPPYTNLGEFSRTPTKDLLDYLRQVDRLLS